MKKTILLKYVASVVVLALGSCVDHEFKDVSTSTNTNESLFAELEAAGYQYYQNGNTLAPASASPHGSFRVRFNETAASSLDSDSELPEGTTFKEGAVIVKEVYKNNALSLYAIMKKAPSDPSAANGWLWAEYALDGTAVYAINQKGGSCTGCHSDTPNRDFVRTFDFH